MDSNIGWLLDVTIEQNRATLWIKTIDGKILKLIDTYQANFYVLPKNENTGAELFHILSQQPKIKRVEWESKFTDLFDYDRHGMKKLICVHPESVFYYETLVKSLEKDPRIAQLFDTDLSHIQQYLFTRLKTEPTSKVEVKYDKNDSRLISLTKINEDAVTLPPFSILYFEIVTSSYGLGSYDVNDPIRGIKARYHEEPEVTFEGSEDTILKDFCRYVLTNDPDILVSTRQHYRCTSIPQLLIARMSELGIDLALGRDNQTNKRDNIEGRIYLDSNSLYSNHHGFGHYYGPGFGYYAPGYPAYNPCGGGPYSIVNGQIVCTTG